MELEQAAAWLVRSNLRNMRLWAFGEVRRAEIHLESESLTMIFRDQKRVVLPVQLLHHYRAPVATWAWARDDLPPELCRTAQTLRDYGRVKGISLLTQPSLEAKLTDLIPYCAMVAAIAGHRGLCLVSGKDWGPLEIVAFGEPRFFDKNDVEIPTERLWSKKSADPAFEAEAEQVVADYDREMYPLDQQYHAGRGSFDDLGAILDAKVPIYERYWTAKNDLWRPNNISGEHDPSVWPTITLPRRAGGCFVVRRLGAYDRTPYVVEAVDDIARIRDREIKWGECLVWPDAPAGFEGATA